MVMLNYHRLTPLRSPINFGNEQSKVVKKPSVGFKQRVKTLPQSVKKDFGDYFKHIKKQKGFLKKLNAIRYLPNSITLPLYVYLMSFAIPVLGYRVMSDPSFSRPVETYSDTNGLDHVRVLASSSQRYLSAAGKKDEQGNKYGAWVFDLVKKVKQPDVKSLEEAHNIIMKNGYSLAFLWPITAYPTATPGKLDIWNKAEINPHRFVVLVGQGQDKGQGQSFINSLNLMEDMFKEDFHVQESQIFRQDTMTNETVFGALDNLVEAIKDVPQDKVEVFVYLASHGSTQYPLLNHFSKEGAANGRLAPESNGLYPWIWFTPRNTGIREEALENYLNTKLKGVKTLVGITACHSGSFTD